MSRQRKLAIAAVAGAAALVTGVGAYSLATATTTSSLVAPYKSWQSTDGSETYYAYRTPGDGNCMYVALYVGDAFRRTGQLVDPFSKQAKAGGRRLRHDVGVALARLVDSRSPRYDEAFATNLDESLQSCGDVSVPQYVAAVVDGSRYGDVHTLEAFSRIRGESAVAYDVEKGCLRRVSFQPDAGLGYALLNLGNNRGPAPTASNSTACDRRQGGHMEVLLNRNLVTQSAP